ncbi:uncharacterized protein (DUF1800 family) [Mariniflexile fucanivorans]|uniref:Uncharacterized protein (DUF1800 family) n=1 Tax=Mariniflexile fucanivorans TaxID=264023 RepID=A0A4R1RDG1_9FLAO|nr:DUF1800 domain-containing protein [Mariniflexile fucanivorans]TCL63562.1 uncharacterized protein (DUF1800 family) [Mariniflexile fucanivorans]
MMNKKHIQHLYWRVGFGMTPQQLHAISKLEKKQVVDTIFKASKKITPLQVDIAELESLMTGSAESMKKSIKDFQSLSREKTRELNIAWIDRLTDSEEQLREKTTLFWANHFVCEDNNFIYTQKFHNTLRTHALGNFKDFVIAISKEAAMTKYLNTKQNKKQTPNENFARELMELFTLGVGNYTEEDIKESARAFTGYSHDLKGDFVFRERQHDDGLKTFFGKTGHFNGDQIIDIILENKQCAQYICQKIYRYFVNDTLDETHVNQMVDVFHSDYNIEKLMRFVFLSDWFYDEKNIGTKIKSPIEFLVGIKTMVPLEFNNPKQLLYLQKLLGQTLLDPPNVAGWKGGRSWIDSNTIVLRLKLPSLLLNNAYISKAKEGETDKTADLQKAVFKKKFGKRFSTSANWGYFNSQFKDVAISDMENYLLVSHMNESASKYLNSLAKVSKQEYCVQLMSLPEYQMC